MNAELKGLEAAEARLRAEILAIVQRFKSHGKPLTWRAMFEIEDEALASLEHAPDLDLRYVDLMVSPSAQRRPGTEELAGLADVQVMHTALWMIQEAYYHAH